MYGARPGLSISGRFAVLRLGGASHRRGSVFQPEVTEGGVFARPERHAGAAELGVLAQLPLTVGDDGRRRLRLQRLHTQVGARPVDGEAVYLQRDNPYGMRRLGGIGLWLEAELFTRCPREIRVTVLGHLQRGGGPTPADRLLATRYGAMAARLAADGQTGTMVALHGQTITAVPLAQVYQQPKQIDPAG